MNDSSHPEMHCRKSLLGRLISKSIAAAKNVMALYKCIFNKQDIQVAKKDNLSIRREFGTLTIGVTKYFVNIFSAADIDAYYSIARSHLHWS